MKALSRLGFVFAICLVAVGAAIGGKSHAAAAKFDPSGYYVPLAELNFGAYRLDAIGLDIESSQHAELRIVRAEDEKLFRYPGKIIRVSPTRLTVIFPKTRLGKVVLDGRFLEIEGSYWANPALTGTRTPVLEADVRITSQRSRMKQVKDVRFSYWEGE